MTEYGHYIPSIIFFQNGILCAKIERPLLQISSVHWSLSKSTDWLHYDIRKHSLKKMVDYGQQNDWMIQQPKTFHAREREREILTLTSSVLYMDNATPPAPVKLYTSSSVFSSVPSGTADKYTDLVNPSNNQKKEKKIYKHLQNWYCTKDKFKFPSSFNDCISSSVLITKSMSSNAYWLWPPWTKQIISIKISKDSYPISVLNNYYLGQAGEYFCTILALWRQCLKRRQTANSVRWSKNNLINKTAHDPQNFDSPFKMFLIVPLGLFHICFKVNSFIRASSVNYTT